jgi:hypothetical protein
MNKHSLTLRIALATAIVLSAFAVQAQNAIVGTGIDANTFRVGHPASPRWVAAPMVRHANGEHPAVLQARHAGQATIDANTFLVQPPASTRWVATPATLVAAAR